MVGGGHELFTAAVYSTIWGGGTLLTDSLNACSSREVSLISDDDQKLRPSPDELVTPVSDAATRLTTGSGSCL